MEHSDTSAGQPAAVAPEPPMSDDKTSRRAHHSALMIVFLVVFIDLLGFGIVLPLLARFGKEFIPGGENSPWKGPILGALMASFSAMQFIFAPIWGRVSDRIGRRPVLLLGLLSSVVFYAFFGYASMLGGQGHNELALVLLFVARIGAGISGATIGTAQAAIADSTTPERRSRGMALIGAAFGIGFTFGPLLGFAALYLFPEAKGAPGYLAAVISLLAFLLGVAILPETLKQGASGHARGWFALHGLQTALRTPGIGTLVVMFFLSTFSFAMFEPTLALVTSTRALGLDDQHNFLVFTYVGLVLALAQGLLYRRLAARLGEVAFIRIGGLLMALGLAGIGIIAMLAEQSETTQQSSLIGGLLLVLAIAVTGFAFVTPSVNSLISRLSDPTRQGEILGVNQSINAMARILGPAAGPSLYFLTDTHILPYALGTSLLVVVFFMPLRIQHEFPG